MSGDHTIGRPRGPQRRRRFWEGPVDPIDPVTGRVSWRFMIRNDWDRLLLNVSFIAFGVWGVIYSWTTSTPSYTPTVRIVYSIFELVLLIVGLLLLVSHRYGSRRIRFIAYQIYVLSLVALAIAVFSNTFSPFGILILGFALHGVILGRLTQAQERVRARVSALIAEDDLSSL